MAPVPVEDLEPVREVADQVLGCDRRAELGEACLTVQPFDEPVQAVAARYETGVVDPRARARGVDQLIGVDPRWCHVSAGGQISMS